MSAFSTVGDVFSDPEFSALDNSFLCGLGALEEPNRECAGFLIMPKRPCEWRVDSHGCYKYDNAALGFGPLTFLCFSISAPPTYLAPTASCAVNMRNKEGLSADITDVLDCDVAHVSAHLSHSLPITCESLGDSCFAPH